MELFNHRVILIYNRLLTVVTFGPKIDESYLRQVIIEKEGKAERVRDKPPIIQQLFKFEIPKTDEHAQMLATRYFFTQFHGEFTADVLDEFLIDDLLFIKAQ
jgi:hypothetical protein